MAYLQIYWFSVTITGRKKSCTTFEPNDSFPNLAATSHREVWPGLCGRLNAHYNTAPLKCTSPELDLQPYLPTVNSEVNVESHLRGLEGSKIFHRMGDA